MKVLRKKQKNIARTLLMAILTVRVVLQFFGNIFLTAVGKILCKKIAKYPPIE